MKRLSIYLILLICINQHQAFAKAKSYNFKSGYVVSCNLNKKSIAEGSQITICTDAGELIMQGKVMSSEPELVVAGENHYWEGDIRVTTNGNYRVTNTSDGRFILDTRKGNWPFIFPLATTAAFYSEETRDVSFTEHDGKGLLAKIVWHSTGVKANSEKKELKVRISDEVFSAYPVTQIDSMMVHTPSGYVLEWADGARFEGDIDCFGPPESFFHLEEGTYTSSSGTESIGRSTEDGFFTYTKKVSENVKGGLRYFSIKIPENVVNKYGLWDREVLIDNGVSGEFQIDNGSIFVGEYQSTTAGTQSTFSFTNGTYTWPSGDVFTGNYNGQSVGGIPVDGKLSLANGSELKRNWWEKLCLSDEEWKSFEQYSCPSDKLIFALSCTNKFLNKELTEIKRLIEDGRLAEADSIYYTYEDIAAEYPIKEDWVKALSLSKRSRQHHNDNETRGTINAQTTIKKLKQDLLYVILVYLLIRPFILRWKRKRAISLWTSMHESAINKYKKKVIGNHLAALLNEDIKHRIDPRAHLWGLLSSILTSNSTLRLRKEAIENTRQSMREKVASLSYDCFSGLSLEEASAYDSFCKAFKKARKSRKIWQVTSRSAINKYRSAADHYVERKEISLFNASFKSLSSSYKVPWFPGINVRHYYFYPRFVIVANSLKAFEVYDNSEIDFLYSNVRWHLTSGQKPFDSKIIDYAPTYANYDGSPDLRYSHNPSIPVVGYGEISINGDEYQFSNKQAAKDLYDCFIKLRKANSCNKNAEDWAVII